MIFLSSFLIVHFHTENLFAAGPNYLVTLNPRLCGHMREKNVFVLKKKKVITYGNTDVTKGSPLATVAMSVTLQIT